MLDVLLLLDVDNSLVIEDVDLYAVPLCTLTELIKKEIIYIACNLQLLQETRR